MPETTAGTSLRPVPLANGDTLTIRPQLTVDSACADQARRLAEQCIRTSAFDDKNGRIWVLLNLPRRSSLTLSLADDKTAASRISVAAKQVLIETFEYLWAVEREIEAESDPLSACAPVMLRQLEYLLARDIEMLADDEIALSRQERDELRALIAKAKGGAA